jgi:hypothetical protein
MGQPLEILRIYFLSNIELLFKLKKMYFSSMFLYNCRQNKDNSNLPKKHLKSPKPVEVLI